MNYGLPEKQYDTREKVIAFHQSILERVRRLPGVRAAGLVSTAPGAGWGGDDLFTIPEHPSTSFQLQNDALHRNTDPGYFTAMQIPLLRGRFFSNEERLTHDRYTIISKRFAEGDPLALSIPVQRQVAVLDPGLPVDDILTMQQILGKATASQSFSATLLLAFAILSLLLAAIGLYGVLSYLVSQRIREIGLRIALGAQRAEVLRLVLFDGLTPILFGLLIGLAGGATAARFIKTILYGTSPLDPIVFATMVGTLLLTAIAACALPALRASRIEPMQALRVE